MKILIIEDDESLMEAYEMALEPIPLVLAKNIEAAQQAFREHNGEFTVIFVDGSVPKNNRSLEMGDTEDLVREFRKTYLGSMIATSSRPDHRARLKIAGCNDECAKEYVPIKAREITRKITSSQQ